MIPQLAVVVMIVIDVCAVWYLERDDRQRAEREMKLK